MKRKILRALDFAALFMILLGGSAADWTPVPIVMAMILIPCAYIGLRQWAERTANE
jgi:hypothetical protein